MAETITTDFGPYKHNESLNERAKALVGSNAKPNKFYIQISNQVMYKDEDGDTQYRPVTGDTYMCSMLDCVDTIEEAMCIVDEIELCAKTGVTSVTIEDHCTGQVYEKTLKEKIAYTEEIMDDTRLID